MEAISDLPRLAKALGFPVKKQGRSWGGQTCPSCGASDAPSNKFSVYVGGDGKWRWKCLACSDRGDAADLLAKAKGITLSQAMKELRGSVVGDAAGSAPPANAPGEKQRVDALQQVLKTIAQKPDSGLFVVGAYLAARGISRTTVNAAIERGLLATMPAEPYAAQRFLEETCGMDLLRMSGLVRPDKKWAAVAFRPMVGLLPQFSGAEFRLGRPPVRDETKAIRYGQLRWPWWWKPAGELQRVLIVEGLIDLLSLVEMGLSDGDAVMALPGAASRRETWFERLASSHPNAVFQVALDADDAGDRAAQDMITSLQGRFRVERLRPAAKDWNDLLLMERKKK